MTNNILVPDYSLPASGYQPLYLYNLIDLSNYLYFQKISSLFHNEAINELKKTSGILTQNSINYLQDQTRQSIFPTAPLGYFDEQRNFISNVTTTSVGSPQAQDDDLLETFY